MDETNEVPTSQESIKTTAEEKPATEPNGTESQESMKTEDIPEEKQTTEEEKSSHESKDSQQTTDDVITSAEPEATKAPAADVVDALAADVIEKGHEVKEKVEESKDSQQEQTETDVKNENVELVECKEVSAEDQESKDEPQQQQQQPAGAEAKEEKEEPPQEQLQTEEKNENEEPKTVVCEEALPESQVDSSVSVQLDPGSTNTEPEVIHQETDQIEHEPEKNDVNVPPENIKPDEAISTTHASEIPSTVIVSNTPDVPAETAVEKPVAPLPTDTLAKPAGESKRRGSIEKMSNFLRQFRSSGGFKKFTASQFMKVWNHYDSDGNGFIADRELDGFLKEFVLSSVGEGEMRPEILSESAMAVFKETFMDAFDENQDGMIDIAELAEILPTDENFLLLFHLKNPLESSVQFMKIWREYDKECRGYIDSKELKSFLKHILDNQKTSVSDEKLEEYTETILNLFDSNRDGKLQLCEMARLMPVKQNFLSKPILKGASCITRSDIDRLFKIYDQNRNGTIEDEELSGLLKDLMDLGKKDYTLNDINNMKKVIMDHWDTDQDGTISKSELRMFLIQQCKLSAESQGLQYDDEDDDYDGDSD